MLVDPDTEDAVQQADEAPEAEAGGQHADAGEGEGGQAEGQEASDEQAAAEPEEVVVSIGDAEPVEEDQRQAPEWVRELRKSNREKDRRIRELEQRVQASQPAQQAPALGPRPTLAGCDFDEDRFAAELEAWHGLKTEVEATQRRAQEQQQAQHQAWVSKLEKHQQAKAAIKVGDYEDAEAVVDELFSVAQQGVMIAGAENSALLKYAIGKNPKKAKELAAIADPIQFAFALAKVESQLKVAPRKAAPVPERTVRGSAPGTLHSKQQLEALRQKAQTTGDFTAYLAAKRKAEGQA